nr:hypothetical protein [Tanacetum cinerariifolium]
LPGPCFLWGSSGNEHGESCEWWSGLEWRENGENVLAGKSVEMDEQYVFKKRRKMATVWILGF